MNSFVVFTALLAAVAATPGFYTPLVFSSQYLAQDELGQYSYGYADHLSRKNEVKSLDGVTRGGYSYVDPEGKLQTVEYTADSNGFKVSASNLPKAPEEPAVPEVEAPKPVEDTPEVAAARAEHLEAFKEVENRSATAEPVKPIVATYTAPAVYGHPTAHGFSYSTHNNGLYYYSAPYYPHFTKIIA